jgi:hypothetical protein
VFNGPEVPMSILFLCVAAVFILRGPVGRAGVLPKGGVGDAR